MNAYRMDELLVAYEEGALSPAERTELLQMLSSSGARRHLVEMDVLKCAVASRFIPAEIHVLPRQKNLLWLAWSPLTAAAAGLVIGLFCSSMVFAYAAPMLGVLKQRTLFRWHEDFENTAPPEVRGIPSSTGIWGGDYARIVGVEKDVSPHGGRKMLSLMRSDFEGEQANPSTTSDQVMVFDLSEHQQALKRGTAKLEASAWFRLATPGAGNRPEERFIAAIAIHAFSGSPTRHHSQPWADWLMDESLALGGRQKPLTTGSGSWQRISAPLQLPTNTRYVAVHIRIKSLTPSPASAWVEFDGAYVDDVSVALSENEAR